MSVELRLRAVLDRYFDIVVVLLLMIALVGGGATYASHVSPGTETVERTASTWERTAAFDHGATVRAGNPVYDRGTKLRDRPVYFPQISPILNGTYRVAYVASERGSLTVRTDLALVLRSSADGATYWRSSRPLASLTERDVAPGQRVAIPFALNLTAVVERVELARERLGDGPGETSITVRAETRLTGEVNGRAVDKGYVDRLTIAPAGDATQVNDPGTVTNRTTRTRSVTVPRERGPAWTVGGPILGLVSLGGVAALAVGRRRGLIAPTAGEQERLRRDQLSEWISRGRVPRAATDGTTVIEVESLEHLVDVAADANRRVVYDPERHVSAVFDDETTYVYRS